MNTTTSFLLGAVAAGAATSVLAAASPTRARAATVGAGTAVTGVLGVVAGGAALAGGAADVRFPGLLPLAGVVITVDPLSGLFIAVVAAVAVAAGVYGSGYSGHGLGSRPAQVCLPAFVVVMLLVPAAGSASTFLCLWELMAVFSLLLVLVEHRERPEVAAAGRWYAVLTHLGLLAVLIGLLLLVAHARDDSFGALREAGRAVPPAVSGTVFVLALLGFGSKAGMMPVHVWLPRAHAEAPSHVSALMSAAMVTLGIYGLLRVGFDLLGGGPRWWWLLVLALGAVSAVYGILQAAVSTDLKRLLAFSTTENLGLVLVGTGAAGLFAASDNRVLAGLALAAGLLHVVNHASFKTLLFLAAGSVLRATGTRDLDALGGLRTGMPLTTAAFGWGALAASALPPGTAFVSEWLLLQALIRGLPSAGIPDAIVMPVAVAAVALTAGLSVATFVKAFGVGFLARPRGPGASTARECSPAMLAGMGLAAAASGLLALLPGLVLPGVGAAGATALGTPSSVAPVTGTVTLELAGLAGSLSPLMSAGALAGGVLVALAVSRAPASRRPRRPARLWDCGAGPLSERMEYTATSFAEPLQRVFDQVLEPERHIDIDHHEESRYLVRAVAYRHAVPDRLERRFYRPVLAAVAGWGRIGRQLATGSVHRYLGYGFYSLCALLMWLAVIR